MSYQYHRASYAPKFGKGGAAFFVRASLLNVVGSFALYEVFF